MREKIYLVFNRKGIEKMLKTKPKNEHFIGLTVIIDDEYFAKHILEATLKVDKNADVSIEEFELELKRLKKID